MQVYRKIVLYAWISFVIVSIAFFIFDQSVLKDIFIYLSSKSVVYVYIGLLLLGVFRGFTGIPSTYLIIFGLFFIPAIPLYFISMIGIVVSSVFVFYFFEFLHLDTIIRTKHKALLDKATFYMNKYELPVIIGWSFTLFLPTDVICYVAGTLRVNIYKFIIGICIGEGIMVAFFIFGGKLIISNFFGV